MMDFRIKERPPFNWPAGPTCRKLVRRTRGRLSELAFPQPHARHAVRERGAGGLPRSFNFSFYVQFDV
jgi:hypothetical protein